MSYIERNISPILKDRVQKSKCTLVVGARQVGKSTLIKHEFSEYNRTNFDDRLTRIHVYYRRNIPIRYYNFLFSLY